MFATLANDKDYEKENLDDHRIALPTEDCDEKGRVKVTEYFMINGNENW